MHEQRPSTTSGQRHQFGETAGRRPMSAVLLASTVIRISSVVLGSLTIVELWGDQSTRAYTPGGTLVNLKRPSASEAVLGELLSMTMIEWFSTSPTFNGMIPPRYSNRSAKGLPVSLSTSCPVTVPLSGLEAAGSAVPDMAT